MDKNITYTNEVVDSYSGQTNCEAGVYVNEEIVGIVQYVLFEDELSISHIFVRPEFRRLGYGSKLMKYIKEENPDYHYVPSFKTDLGAAFKPKEVSLTEKQNFTRDENPLKSLGIGHGDKMKTNAWKILEFIRSKGKEGASFTEIQKFDWVLAGKPEEDFYKKMSETPRYIEYYANSPFKYKDQRVSRGWGVGKLIGSGDYPTRGRSGRSRPRIGLLNRFCEKNEKGKWGLVRMPEVGEPLMEGNSAIPIKELEDLTNPVDTIINDKKMVPFRSIIKEVSRNNFHISSQVDFKEIHLTSHFNDIRELWATLSDKGTNFKSRGGSEYWISDKTIYRLSDHWGGVASCFWTIEGEGDPNFQIEKIGPFRIGWAHIKDFKDYHVRFKKQDLIDPEWCDEIIKPLTETLEDLLKIKEAVWEDAEVPGETKGFIGKHIYKYRKTITEIEENQKRMR